MLRSIRIKNYALIDSLELEFPEGLTIITGQTGAGKSIMLDALSLLMGGRAESRVISDKADRSLVEAVFEDTGDEVAAILEERGVEPDPSGQVCIRREISASGRSRIFVNDRSVTLQTLSAVSSRLVDIHSQHANAKITDPSVRLDIVDIMADNGALRREYAEQFSRYAAIHRRLKTMRENLRKAAENRDFLKFQLDQLDRLKPRRGELAEIERRYEVLSDADDIRERLSRLASILGAPDRGVADMLSEARAIAEKTDFSLLQEDTSSGEGENQVSRRLADVLVEVKDLFETVEDYRGDVAVDPAALAALSARMNLYYETVKRFRVATSDELADLHEEIRMKLRDVESGGTDIPELEAEARKMAASLRDLAAELSESRRRGGEILSELIMDAARPLGLPNISFKVDVVPGKLTVSGRDTVEFLCSFNKNGVPLPLQTIASGGEISRIMLSLKSVMASRMKLPTIIFDEVDTGVSGEIADKMGQMMCDMARSMQVMVITHLPQVAAKGDCHFKVYKSDEADRTVTHVRQLGDEERVREIAGMMSGSEVTDAALMAARALLGKQ